MTPALPYGLILAGGLGRRMASAGSQPPGDPQARERSPTPSGAGSPASPDAATPALAVPKPLVALAGRPLIGHVVERLRPQVAHLLVNANDPPDWFAQLGLPVLPDTLPDRPGPLAGVLAGLDWLARESPGTPLLTVAADTPFLPLDLAARLAQRHAYTNAVVCAGSGGQTHHVIALWPASARPALRAALEAGQRKVGLLLTTLGAVTESWETAKGDPFFNVNTPEDLATAEFRSSASR